MSAPGFFITIRVYYEDTDALGVVYYANYLKFMERARSDWLRFHGHDHNVLLERNGIVFVVTRFDVRYLQPARLDDELKVGLRVTRMGRAGFDMQQWVERANNPRTEETLCTAQVRIGCLHAATMKPHRIPDSLLTELQGDH